MRTPPPRRLAVALALVATLLLSACGGEAATTDAAEPAADTQETDAAVTEAGGTEVGGADDAPSEVTVTHAQGETTVPYDPETVVVFDLGVLDTLEQLGVEAAGVPEIASMPPSIEHYMSDDTPKVGTLFEPDYEAVNALEPDLILVGGRSSEVYPDLAELAPTLDLTVDNDDFLASFRERTTALATVFGLEDEAEQRLADIDEAVERTSEAAADAGTGLIVLTTGGEVSAYGPGSRFGLIHDELGVEPAASDLTAATHGDAVSFEYLLETNPDRLYVLDRDAATGEGGAAAEQVLDNELVAQTTAWQNDDVFYLDPTTWYLAPNGLGSVESMIAEVEASLE